MTREERLDWLCRLRSEIYVYMPQEWIKPMDNALTESIKALEQEPICDRDCEHCTWTECPIEPCDDAISREAVYSILNEHHIDEDRIKSDMDERQNLTVNSIASDVSLLPSVTQKSAESEDKTE